MHWLSVSGLFYFLHLFPRGCQVWVRGGSLCYLLTKTHLWHWYDLHLLLACSFVSVMLLVFSLPVYPFVACLSVCCLFARLLPVCPFVACFAVCCLFVRLLPVCPFVACLSVCCLFRRLFKFCMTCMSCVCGFSWWDPFISAFTRTTAGSACLLVVDSPEVTMCAWRDGQKRELIN